MSTRPAPSFAVSASALLSKNLPVDAARLCARGLEYFPDYVVGYLLLADAYRAMAQVGDAQLILDEARRRLPHYADLISKRSPVEKDVEMETLKAVEPKKHRDVESVLRIIDMAPPSGDQRIIRSASVRLIPGLEYTTLRFEGMRSRGRREISQLSEPPPFRAFHSMRRMARLTDLERQTRRPVSLEELAARLGKARMPRPADVPAPATPVQPPRSGPTVVTETIARIYMQQGSIDRAIEAFRVLQHAKPEQHSHFEALIVECERTRT